MVDAVLTHQNIPTGYRLLPRPTRHLFFGVSLSLKPGLDLISRTASIDSVSLSFSRSVSPRSHALCPFLLSHHGPSIRSVRVIPGSNSSQSHAIIFKTSKPIRKSSYAAAGRARSLRPNFRSDRTIKSWHYIIFFCNAYKI